MRRAIRQLKTSPDFETILRTRIRIESGIQRRRLQAVSLPWPTRIPVYGIALALIIIASVLVIDNVTKSRFSYKPEALPNTGWYGGNPSQNIQSPVVKETDNYIYAIDRVSPQDLIDNYGTSVDSNSKIESFNNQSDSVIPRS